MVEDVRVCATHTHTSWPELFLLSLRWGSHSLHVATSHTEEHEQFLVKFFNQLYWKVDIHTLTSTAAPEL